MKNYLFAPFKDHEDKINAFNSMIGGLETMIDEEDTQYHELSGLRIFIGRLESYYDVIISELQAENKKLKADMDEIRADNIDLINHQDFEKRGKFKEVIEELKAENVKLKADIIKLEGHVDKYGGIAYDKLKAENIRLTDELQAVCVINNERSN